MKQTLKQQLEQYLAAAMQAAGIPEDCPVNLTRATKPEFGDYQSNGAMPAAKKMGRKPRDLAGLIVENLARIMDEDPDCKALIGKTEIAGPGFINIHLDSAYLNQVLSAAMADVDSLIVADAHGQTIVVDYSGPNLAKEMHVGHLRSTIIGDSMVRVLTALGHNVIKQNHVGDWGTQFGMLITHMTDLQGSGRELQTELSDLESFYRDAKVRFDKEPDFAKRARDQVVKLQSGDAQCLQHWQQFIKISLQHCFEVYQRLGVLLQEADLKPESAYNDQLPVIVQTLKDKNLLTESDGAACVFFDEFKGKDDKPLPIIVQKSDGGYLYATTDLAALQHRGQNLGAKRVLYVVDIRQGLHFKQVFRLALEAGFVSPDCSLEHIGFGTILGPDGKPLKTREGGTPKLMDLLDDAVAHAVKVVAEMNPELSAEQSAEIGSVVGINAVKYADLSKNRKSDYMFELDKMVALEGNTAPYMMYAYARIQSILRKANTQGHGASSVDVREPQEKVLALKIVQFPEVLQQVGQDAAPHAMCQYLYELAGVFMTFYESCPVLKDNVEAELRGARLALCQVTAAVLKQGFDMLGLTALDKM